MDTFGRGGMMKKAAFCLMAIVLLLSLCACVGKGPGAPQVDITQTPDVSAPQTTPPDAESPEYPFGSPSPAEHPNETTPAGPDKAGRLGFQGGNIGAGGLVCDGGDGYIYYRSESDRWRLYKARPDGSEKTKLSDAAPDCINVLDGWVYYLNYRDGFSIWKVRTDGTGETKLADGYCGNLYVAESGMYFDMRDENNAPSVYRADLDGGNMTLLYPKAWMKYYYGGKVYVYTSQLIALDIATGEEKAVAPTYIHNVTVDESGIYYWAVNEGEYRQVDLDGTNARVLVKGGDYFNYCDGVLYYTGIGENKNGPCHIVYKLNLDSNEKTVLLEEANEFFDQNGMWLGVTFRQLQESAETIDPALFEQSEEGQIFKGLNESVWYVLACGEHLYMRAALRESLVQKGRLDCIARLDGGVVIWD
jgi:predicted small lipoprotein YifL